MSVHLRRLLVALLVAGSGVFVGAAPAQAACECSSETTEDRVKQSRNLFTGVVVESTRLPGDDRRSETFRLVVEVDQIYKGDIDTTEVEVATEPRFEPCGGGEVEVGEPYLFLLPEGDELLASGCGGVEAATDLAVERVESLVGAGRPPVPPEPEPVVFTPVDDSEPQTLSRAAAPGVALVIVGLLGLVVVRRLGRSRG